MSNVCMGVALNLQPVTNIRHTAHPMVLRSARLTNETKVSIGKIIYFLVNICIQSQNADLHPKTGDTAK